MDITSPELLGFSSSRLGRIKTVMQRYVDQNKLAGILTLVARHGQVAHLETVGYANIEAAKALEVDALFRIYSMTKPITSTAMMMLFEEGRFRLTDPLYAYIPAFKEMQVLTNATGDTVAANRPITIRDLFTHTSGLGYGLGSTTNALCEQMYVQNYWMPILSNPALTLPELFDGIAKLPLVGQPGAAWSYCVGIDVLGLLVQVISGMSFPAYLKRNLFEPLGMTDTDFYAPPEKLGRLATAYGPKGLTWPMAPTTADLAGGIAPVDVIKTNGSFTEPTNVPSGGGGLISSTSDYLSFAQMLLNEGELNGERILGRKTVEMMFMNHLPDGVYSTDDHAFGFGLGGSVLLDPAKSQVLGSAGTWSWGGAANTEFWIDPREDLIGLLMAQFLPGGAHPLYADFRNLTYQALVD